MIKGIGFTHEKFYFPTGEMQVRIKEAYGDKRMSVHFLFEQNEEIFELLLIVDALKRMGLKLEGIAMPYIPFSRQDRINQGGEALSIKIFADLINQCGAEVVEVDDPHSDVSTALINNLKVRTQVDIHEKNMVFATNGKPVWFISPDAGALKKIYKMAEKNKAIGVVECSKKRNTTTGEITGVEVHIDSFNGKDCVIVDDICDGGKTFIEIAKILKQKDAGKITLMVTHGFFTKGLEVFDGLIDEIYTREGFVQKTDKNAYIGGKYV